MTINWRNFFSLRNIGKHLLILTALLVYVFSANTLYMNFFLKNGKPVGGKIDLQRGQGEIAPEDPLNNSMRPNPELEALSQIIQELNQRFGTDFTEGVATTMLIVSALPLIVAVLVFFLVPRRPDGAGARTP